MTRRTLLLALAVVVIAVAVNWWTSDHDSLVDLSSNGRFSLSADTKRLVGQVKAPLHVTVFLNTTAEDARQARFLLDRYHSLNHDITYEVADPDTDPGLARRFGITDYSTVVLQYRGKRVDAPDPLELDLSSAILELLQGVPPHVCVLSGHGEDSMSDTSDEGFSNVAQLLADNDYTVAPLNLTVGANPIVPSTCAVVMIDGPHDPLLAAEVAALVAYAQGGGRLLVLATPLSNDDPNPLLNPWGIHFIGGLVVDPNNSEGSDLSNLIVGNLPSVSPVDVGIAELQFPAAGALTAESNELAGLDVQPLAVTGADSYVAPNAAGDIGFQQSDLTGPQVVAAAADASRVEPSVGAAGSGTIIRTRVVATGTDIWATNGFLDDLSNRRFLVNSLAWLTERNQLLVATDRPDVTRPLPFTPARQEHVIEITVVLIPLLILALGSSPALVRKLRGT